MGLRVCVIGCGYMATAGHGPAYKEYRKRHSGFSAVACCDVDGERAERFCREFGFERSYRDWRRMVDAEQPNAVCLLVPPGPIASIGCELLAQGIPLLLEKPPGLEPEETRRLMQAARASGAHNLVAFNRRYMPAVSALREGLAGERGPIRVIRYEMLRIDRRDPDFSTTAIHGFDLVRYVGGCDYRKLSLRYEELPAFGPGVADVAAEGVLESGASVHLSFRPVSIEVAERIEVHGDGWQESIDLPQFGPGADSVAACGFLAENEAFFDAVSAGRDPPGSVSTCLQSVEAASCMRHRMREFP